MAARCSMRSLPTRAGIWATHCAVWCRVHWLLRNDAPGSYLHGRIVEPKENIAAAVKLMLATAPGH
jgi:hypothetical protein